MKCPICKKPVEIPAASDSKSPYPFCSERCSLIDLGRWLDGKYQIPTSPTDDDSEMGPTPVSDPGPEE
jgi:endogenous inhibitor of DNA gyrase (YacG/DUF329 family)